MVGDIAVTPAWTRPSGGPSTVGRQRADGPRPPVPARRQGQEERGPSLVCPVLLAEPGDELAPLDTDLRIDRTGVGVRHLVALVIAGGQSQRTRVTTAETVQPVTRGVVYGDEDDWWRSAEAVVKRADVVLPGHEWAILDVTPPDVAPG